MEFCSTHLRPIAQEVLKISICKIHLKKYPHKITSTSPRGQWVTLPWSLQALTVYSLPFWTLTCRSGLEYHKPKRENDRNYFEKNPQNLKVWCLKKVFVVCKMEAILFWTQWGNPIWPGDTIGQHQTVSTLPQIIEPTLTNHQQGLVAFTWGWCLREYPRYMISICAWNLRLQPHLFICWIVFDLLYAEHFVENTYGKLISKIDILSISSETSLRWIRMPLMISQHCFR